MMENWAVKQGLERRLSKNNSRSISLNLV